MSVFAPPASALQGVASMVVAPLSGAARARTPAPPEAAERVRKPGEPARLSLTEARPSTQIEQSADKTVAMPQVVLLRRLVREAIDQALPGLVRRLERTSSRSALREKERRG